MKNILRHGVLSIAFSFLFLLSACAQSAQGNERKLPRKILQLTDVACDIYPAITDQATCINRILENVLAERGLDKEQREIWLREGDEQAATRISPRAENESLEEFQGRLALAKYGPLLRESCKIEPAIEDFDACVEKIYHSILTSRDPHSGYMNKQEAEQFFTSMSGEFQGIGAEVGLTTEKKVAIIRVLEGSPAEAAGVRDGDRIVAITNGNERVLTSSFKNASEAVAKLRGKGKTKVTIEVLRGDSVEPIIITIVRGVITVKMVTTESLSDPENSADKYAFVRITQFGTDVRKKMTTAVEDILRREQGAKGIIFDVRSNPGGSLSEVYEMVDTLVDSPDPLVSIRNNEGIRPFGSAFGERAEPQPGDITKGLPCAVLVDEYSASASEIFAGALKHLERCVIIGIGTWRKGSIQMLKPCGDETYCKVTEAEYLIGSPKRWVAVQCVGVEPDITYLRERAEKAEKEVHECDLPRAIVSGGPSSDPSAVIVPLRERDPVLYEMGERVLRVVKERDRKETATFEERKKRLKLETPKSEKKKEEKKK